MATSKSKVPTSSGSIGVFGFTPTLSTSSIPGSGGAANGGILTNGFQTAKNGADGAVYLRWASTLAKTSFANSGLLTGALTAIALGAMTLAFATIPRLVNRAKHRI